MRIIPNFLFLALAAVGTSSGASAQLVNYVYDLHLPSISGVTEVDTNFTDYAFSWEGPLRFNSPDGSSCPTVCGPVTPGSTVEAGFLFRGFSFTATPTTHDSEVLVNFRNSSADSIQFEFIEPDSFWASQTTQTFASNTTVPLTDGTGASYVTLNPDPGCNSCSVTITAGAQTPEPNSWLLLSAGFIAFVSLLRRRSA